MRSGFKLIPTILAVICCSHSSSGISIISKAQWGGRNATSTEAVPANLDYAVIHHSAGAYCNTSSKCKSQMRIIQDYHMLTLQWEDIGYHFAIGGDAAIYEGRGFGLMGAHAYGWNRKSIGIMFIGDYNKHTPTAEQVASANELLDYAVSLGHLAQNYTLYGHREVGATECPGNNLFNEIRKWPHWKAV